MFHSQVFKVLSLVAVLSFGSACQKTFLPKSDLVGEALLADRPVLTPASQIYLIELKEKPLLSDVSQADGPVQLDPEKVELVKKEHQLFEEKLKNISAEIQVVYRYQYILNGMSIIAPTKFEDQIKALSNVKNLQVRKIFLKPKVKVLQAEAAVKKAIDLVTTSVTHIEAGSAYDLGFKGQGIRVGILDTGIDYTHGMLGGSGKVEDYESVNPDAANAQYPNKKVLGGIDLVGSVFDTASLDSAKRLPKPDVNPIDEEGHGTHVAGTVAGIGDNVNTYSGVAPEADLYAIKVFGSGSTSDEVVIAGLEWAVDPNQDGDLSDQLHVVNLSLGGGNGTSYELYNKAVTNLTRAGTVVVASAGNSSDVPFIVGSPSTSDEALSVAASIDSSIHNWKFKTVGFISEEKEIALAEAIEGQTSKPIAEAGEVTGELVFIGLADKDLNEEQSALVKGKVALVDRGVVTFQEKLSRAEKAGAIGVILAQNKDEAPFTMGGDTKLEIPAIMITQALGNLLKEQMKKAPVVAVFQNPKMIEKPELINRITDFSSRGPRSVDLLIKPEITGPGQNIISAAMGLGVEGVKLSGTSMSGPHLAGVMALMKQKFSKLSTKELKSVVMSTSVPVKNDKNLIDTVARQGAGHVDVSRALKAQFVTDPVSLSLGLQQVDKQKKLTRSLRIRSLFDDALKLQVSLETTSAAITLQNSEVSLSALGLSDLKLNFNLNASKVAGLEEEVTGWVVLKVSETHSQRIPFLVRLQKVSNIKMTGAEWGASSSLELEGSASKLEFTNRSMHAGEAWLFNLLGQDSRKPAGASEFFSRECDLKAVGYRLNGSNLEIAVKMFSRVSTWNLCEVSVLFDNNQDQKPELELALTVQERVPGLTGLEMVSTLLDFPKARALREEAEKKSATSEERIELDLSKAILAQQSGQAEALKSAVILKVDLSILQSQIGREPKIQVVTSSQEGKNTESDDFLKTEKYWQVLSLDANAQSWKGLQNITLQGGEIRILELEKGASPSALFVLMPQNSLDSMGLDDQQLEIIKPSFRP
jgi:minor extracellular serine protease Vpr